jgi:hypothetical protein
LSEFCKIRNAWKLPSTFSRNTLIQSSEKICCSLKTSFWKKNCPINLKTIMKKFSHERLPCKSLYFMVLGYPCKKSQNYGSLYTWKIFMHIFEFFGQFFFQNDVFKLQEVFSELELRLELSLRTDSEVSRHFLFYRFETNQRWIEDFKNRFQNYTQIQKKLRILSFSENAVLSLSEATQ